MFNIKYYSNITMETRKNIGDIFRKKPIKLSILQKLTIGYTR